MMKDFYIHRSAYHDGSTKGFRHGIKHKRHDCFRGDVRVLQRIDGKMVQISRVRKRFKTYEDAYAWARGFEYKE
ncbi:hypothetical protein EUX50_02280 [Haemophilus haemolyticus]|uniref:AP2 domain n=1 Tax=Haemophilus haemolyticus TaxID=726 RepID=A0ABY2YUI1_HAEHA|nr:hypothetical protein [Haemophilus haemolyticus]TPH07161.1 hypothetical protein EUX50_02280 [Haemophilus haemolyticus]